jgi:hypothetical protein
MTYKHAAQNLRQKSLKFTLMFGLICSVPASIGYADNTNTAFDAQITPAQFVEDKGASERINFSGKLRMLSQRVVAASCYLQAGIQTDASRATLAAATTEFAVITNALEFGDPDLGIIGAEDRRRTLAGISKLNELWAPIAELASKVEAGTGSVEDITAIAEQSAPLLDIAQRLVVQITSEYASQTTVLQTDAFAIDLAGRQRMLSQRISKNVCLISSGVSVETSQAELANTAQNFEATLFALRDGLPDAGVSAPPNQEVEDGLNVVIQEWATVTPIVAEVAASIALDAEQLGIVFQTGNQMTGNMNAVVGLYAEASKLGL